MFLNPYKKYLKKGIRRLIKLFLGVAKLQKFVNRLYLILKEVEAESAISSKDIDQLTSLKNKTNLKEVREYLQNDMFEVDPVFPKANENITPQTRPFVTPFWGS